jgi:putative ABC transport system permease protein
VIGRRVFDSGMASSRPSRRAPAPVPAESLQGRTITLALTRFDGDGRSTTRSERLRVVGVLDGKGGEDDYSVILAADQVDDLNAWFSGRRRNAREGYEVALVKVADRRNVKDVQAAIGELGFETFSSQDILQAINQVFLIVQGVLGGIGAVALLVAAFGIANTMTMAIYERTREIGIMKALGATNRDVLRIFLVEAGAIGVLGGLLGCLTGWLAGLVIDILVRNWLLAQQSGGEVTDPGRIVITPPWLLAFALAFAALIGLASGVYPALRAASMRPLSALRTE